MLYIDELIQHVIQDLAMDGSLGTSSPLFSLAAYHPCRLGLVLGRLQTTCMPRMPCW